MGTGRLASYVHVTDEEGRTHMFGPSSSVPAWAAEKITNPRAWAEPPSLVEEPPPPPGNQVPTGSEGEQVPDPDRPPPSGPGSGKSAWKTYADSLSVAYPADASRDDIVALVDAAKEE